ncbi:recombinase family protein [Gemmiger formicilis]|uniref:recombinase family protein n=1 Tax=Gemmiger formicilis TaxID=745368 RepID=UPI00307A05AB
MIVNDIFKSYLSGMSINEIAEHLNTIYPKENSKWNPRTIHAILRNEKYIGDSLYQKTYTTDSLPLKRYLNTGQRSKYYAMETHEGIISKTDYEKVQNLLAKKSNGQILGYRKGLDGKPEVIPEEAEVIRMIFNSYLQGASLLTIKKKLEAGGVLTARGNKKWSSESVQRILQNEKYCGDVLLQKTFIEDVLTGVSKKNTGQLPQYYIENNHEGIVTKQMFREVQAEIARRNSKSAANQRKRHQGRYNSKYALSERLVCGDCGSPYKRVTWNIHGRKQIVWRCVNRLEYGTKFCSHSPSIPEEELHQAILKAVQNLAANFTDEVAAQLDGILRQMKAGENLKAQLQKQLEKAQQEFDRLLEMSLELDESTPFLDDKLRKLSGKIKILKANIAESTDGKGEDEEATKQLTAQDLLIKEYDDILTARIIEKVIVHSRQEIEIYFIGGYTQKIDLI